MDAPNDDQLPSLYARRINLEDAKQVAADDIKAFNDELKGLGHDVTVFNAAFKRLQDDSNKVAERDILLERYETAMGGA